MYKSISFLIIIFILGVAGGSPAFGANVSFYVYDRPDRSVTALTSTSADIINQYKYDSFGNITLATGVVDNDYTYDGEARDSKANLLFLRHRSYDTTTGRFISKDPHPGFDTAPQTTNPYPYCVNNPVNFIDPKGEALPLIIAGLIATAAWGWYNEAMDAFHKGGNYADINNAGAVGAISNEAGLAAGLVTKNPLLSGAASGLVSSAIKELVLHNNNINLVKVVSSSLISALSSGVLSKVVPLQVKAPGWLNILAPKDLSITNGMDSVRYVAKSIISPTLSTGLKVGYNSLISFGGVSLSKTASLMLNIQDVGGATFDQATGQVILYGKKNLTLPDMKLDDLSVAVSSVYGLHKAPQDPGVSIGTEASDVPGQMKVRYDGDTFNTAFGLVMFDADRLLKTLTLGKDNITGDPVTSSVPGYQNMLDRRRAAGGAALVLGNSTNRMWFTPKEISLIQSADGGAMESVVPMRPVFVNMFMGMNQW